MEKISKRVLEEAEYIIETNDTIRETAKRFKVSKIWVVLSFLVWHEQFIEGAAEKRIKETA